MAFATLNGSTVTAGRVTLPASGVWHADLTLDEGVEVAASSTLKVGDLELTCAPRRGRAWLDETRVTVEGGAAGWRTVTTPRGYALGGGVLLSTVVADLALAAGETIRAGFTDAVIGASVALEAGVLGRALDRLVGVGGWYVDTNGETVLSARPEGLLLVDGFEVLDLDEAKGCAMLATETPARLQPGARVVVNGQTRRLSTVVLHLEGQALRAEVFFEGVEGEDRLWRAMQAAVRRAVGELTYLGVWEYRVTGQSGERFELEPTDPTRVPPLANVEVRGAPGLSAEPVDGSRVLVSFINGDVGRPYVCAFEAPDGEGFVPGVVELDGDEVILGSGQSFVVRYGDVVTVGTESGAIALSGGPALGIPTKVKA